MSPTSNPMRILIAASVLFTLTGPALAQAQMAPQSPPQDMAPAPMSGPSTEQLNRGSDAYTAERADMHRAQRGARYAADRDAYMAALIAHDRAVNRYDHRYVRQQEAYADAMAAWRRQVAACHRGRSAACRAPAPQVADFY
ncbi:hypothetical protein [Polymorphobacter megasporae]|uniref:hypothetical protein n=1 Tax=Glacieibacterium megasporae TaxID=2835787 RepID=UPI001C1E51EB|nr:hypothetical protein [Polymorphobacter megasporae]UAJ11670.1 hypothetical protein KTC28_08430 [Polymorphobacter megasporae]